MEFDKQTQVAAYILQERYRLYAPYLLAAALTEFDFFNWLKKHPSTFSEICSAFKTAERSTDVMLTLFQASGYITRKDDIFQLTEAGEAFLTSDSPTSFVAHFQPLFSHFYTQSFIHVLRTDEPTQWGGSDKDWHQSMQDNEFAETFTTVMDCRGTYLGPLLAQKVSLADYSHLLDIGGSSGIYACCFVQANPKLKATVFDLPTVEAPAKDAIARRGLSDRVAVYPGNMFEDSYPAADAHLLSNVLHDWDFASVQQIIQNSYSALPSGGLLIIHDAHLNEAKDGPLPVAEYSTSLVRACRGRCYSVKELKDCLESSGFGSVQYQENACYRSVITAVKP